jgi:GcvH upstream region-like protein
MLHFFRTYERYFYAAITVVIVITFSFFGTYNQIANTGWSNEAAFQAVDGSKISRTDLQNMVHFISTDGEDKLLFGGSWGPNFLNNGVIKQDFLQTGLAEVLVQHYHKDLNEELQRKLEKEKKYALYTHPQAKFLGVDSVWTHLAPDVKSSFDVLRLSTQATDPDSFSSRVQLFLGERKLPASIVRNVLRYQERQYNWVTPDPNLERIDLSLFGYHTAEDWFGSRFIHLVSQFIINAAKVAEERGYVVTKNEALADLIQQSEKSFQENRASPYIGLASSREYFKEQLRRMNIDQNSAAQIWRQVLLFRRLFHDMGNSAFVDPLTVEQVYQFDNESVRGDIYQLPKPLQLNDWRALQKFEAYLEAVAKEPRDKDLLKLPTQFKTVAEVAKAHPELVQKRYLVEIAEIDKKALQSSLGIKETWNWEVAEANWNKLQKQFPELNLKALDNTEARFAVLEQLDSKTRARVDTYARSQIIEEDTHRIAKALQEAKSQKMTLNLKKKGGNSPIAGLKNPQELIDLLDKAPLATQEASLNTEAEEIAQKLKQYSANGSNFYRISVLEKAPSEEIMTFDEASQQGVLNDLLKRLLEAHYVKIRENYPADFQNEDNTWKEFSSVQSKVAELYFAPLLSAISEDYRQNRPQESSQLIQNLTPELSAPLRFYAHIRNAHQTAIKSHDKLGEYVAESSTPLAARPLSETANLPNQWKLSKAAFLIDREHASPVIVKDRATKMSVGEWSAVQPLPNGDIFFYAVTEKGLREEDESFKNQLIAAKQMLSDEAQRMLMKKLLDEFTEKKAISFDYLSKNSEEEIEPELPPAESE